MSGSGSGLSCLRGWIRIRSEQYQTGSETLSGSLIRILGKNRMLKVLLKLFIKRKQKLWLRTIKKWKRQQLKIIEIYERLSLEKSLIPIRSISDRIRKPGYGNISTIDLLPSLPLTFAHFRSRHISSIILHCNLFRTLNFLIC